MGRGRQHTLIYPDLQLYCGDGVPHLARLAVSLCTKIMTPAYPQPRLRPARRYIASTPEFCDANEMQSSSSPYATARMPRGVEARCFCCPSTLVRCRRFNVAFPSSSPPPQAKLPLTAPHPHGVFANKYPYARELACLNSMSCYCLFFFFFFFFLHCALEFPFSTHRPRHMSHLISSP